MLLISPPQRRGRSLFQAIVQVRLEPAWVGAKRNSGCGPTVGSNLERYIGAAQYSPLSHLENPLRSKTRLPARSGVLLHLLKRNQGERRTRQRPSDTLLQPMFGEWLSLVEHLLREQGVGGSNPLSPTIFFNNLPPFHPATKSRCRRFCSGESLRVQQERIP